MSRTVTLDAPPARSAEAATTGQPIDLNPTIYHKAWWLALCGAGKAEEVSVKRDDVTIARMPFILTRHLGLVTCSLPPLVHFGGPAFAPMDGPPLGQMQRRNDLTRDLIARLPRHDLFSMKLYHGVTDTLAFQRDGFKTAVQFSFEVDPVPPDKIWAAIRRGHRRLIRDAQAIYAVDVRAEPGEFVTFYASNIANAGKSFRYDAALVTRLIAACLERGRGQVALARDASGAPKAGLFTMWDSGRMYNFLGTRDAGREDGSASVLLVWSALQEAAKRGLIFDFDGVFNAGQVQYFSGFGGRVTPRYIVSRATKTARMAYGLYDLARSRKEHVF